MEKRIAIPVKPIKEVFKWQSKTELKSVTDMDDDHLQKALITSQKSELYYHNKATFFSKATEALLEEGERRSLKLTELDELKQMGDYFRNKRILQVK